MSRYHANELLDKSKQKNDIQHWKYVKKIKVGSGNRYFYSWDEYKAYLADPTAELEKVGNRAKQEIKTAGKKASVQIKKTGKKSYKEIQSRGKKAVEKMSARQTKGNVTLGVVKAKNKSRPESFKQKLDGLAKKVSENWNNKKESIKEKIDKGKEWIKSLFGKKEDNKEKTKEKTKEKQKDPYEKYKYVKKITINGKTRYFYSQEELDVYNKRSDYAASDPEFMKEFKRSKDPYTKQEDAALVNPLYDRRDNNNDYEYNCRECTMIYELRRRGYDVESNGVSGYVDHDSGILERIKGEYTSNKYNGSLRPYFENPNTQKCQKTSSDEETARVITREIDKNPPGSRGEIAVCWKDGGAHSMVWEKDEKGKITIIDSQLSGSGYHTTHTVEELSTRVDNTGKGFLWTAKITRTDNLKLKKGMTKICKNSSGNHQELGYRWSSNFYGEMNEKEKITQYPVLMEEQNRKKKKKKKKKSFPIDDNDVIVMPITVES